MNVSVIRIAHFGGPLSIATAGLWATRGLLAKATAGDAEA